ncbi:MAG TPA: preprotein translocase subunit SecE [Thermoanaerobaculia bacterium]|nr:preprotein translocase subunit SecE [Thermoanaerobaculia bacterium]
MARDRRRAKQRRDRQARASGGAKARRAEADAGAAAAPDHDAEHPHEHEPAELATGEVDLAEAQLALGRPELTDATQPSPRELVGAADEAEVEGDETTFEALEDRVDEAEEAFEEGRTDNGHAEGGEELVRERTAAPPAEREGNRLANFLRGSWRELQRVQWPDRRQVGQATAVVVGFVIVAGSFLGLMDFVASRIVNLIV